MKPRFRLLLALAAAVLLGAAAPPPAAPATTFTPPPDSAIPPGPFGQEVRLGENIFRYPATYAPHYVGNELRCSNCHFQAGRQAWVAPLWAAYVSFPTYRSKNGHVNTFAQRLQGCFHFSMNGKPPPLGGRVLVALESYAYFLARGLPIGVPPVGRGYPKLPPPPLPANFARGSLVFTKICATCHGPDGQGTIVQGKVVFPPLWGPHSFNWGAGMASIKTAARFIHANMPFGRGGSLSTQQAWDVAAFVDSQVRPQDPRFHASLAATRRKFHHSAFSMYGRRVNGVLLGDPASTPPAGTVPAAPKP